MTTDTKSIETLVEIVTHEILSVLTEEEKKNAAPQGEYCKVECTDDLCVTTCFNEIGQVINAGADRITSTFGSLPDDLSIAHVKKRINTNLLLYVSTPQMSNCAHNY